MLIACQSDRFGLVILISFSRSLLTITNVSSQRHSPDYLDTVKFTCSRGDLKANYFAFELP